MCLYTYSSLGLNSIHTEYMSRFTPATCMEGCLVFMLLASKRPEHLPSFGDQPLVSGPGQETNSVSNALAAIHVPLLMMFSGIGVKQMI